MDEKEKEALEKAKQEAHANIEKLASEKATDVAKETLKSVDEKVKEITEKFEGQVKDLTSKEEVENVKKELNKSISELQAKVKAMKQTTVEEKSTSLHSVISSTISENVETLKGLKEKSVIEITKAVTDASFTGGALANQTTDVRRNLYSSPYSPIYLRNIFPNVTTDSGIITIPQVQEITGAVAAWARGTGEEGADVEKPEVSPIYKDIQVAMEWIAGFTTVNRELLLNVNYLQASITNTLLYSRNGLFAAENKKITDYLSTNAIAYGGSKTVALEKIIDAAFNQLLGNYFNPTHILMNQADYLTHIKLNKASGSGEYDLPNELLRGFTGSGLETNIQVVPVPTLAAGTAYVVSAPEFEFISRLSPQLEVSPHHDKNFTFNKVTFRIEEMAGFVAKDLNAMVKVTF